MQTRERRNTFLVLTLIMIAVAVICSCSEQSQADDVSGGNMSVASVSAGYSLDNGNS